MRAVYQRVKMSRVDVGGETVASIGPGAMILLGVGAVDSEEDARQLADKVACLRVFEDDQGRMNHSLLDVGGEVLVVSQFTLFGDCRKGRRPSFTAAAAPDPAQALYGRFCKHLRDAGLVVREGIFRAKMNVHILNDGPVTLLLDSRREF